MTKLYVEDTNTDHAKDSKKARSADLVVLRHEGGLFSVVKDRTGVTCSREPWDNLPGNVKVALARYDG